MMTISSFFSHLLWLGFQFGLLSLPNEEVPVMRSFPASDNRKVGKIHGYDFADKKPESIKLPRSLREISGLAFTSDGRLLCHNDEVAIVFEIDPKTGDEVKRFFLGKPIVRQDFEGIAAKNDALFLVTSNGNIYRAREGQNRQRVKFERFRTPLSRRYDVEGLAYDPETDCLLLACKGYAGKGLRNRKAVYSFSLKTYKLDPQPRFVLNPKEITRVTGEKQFNPSAIDRHPISGHFFILASNGRAIVEVDGNGKVIGISRLRKSANAQPEGLAIDAEGTVFIANEGHGRAPRLNIYRAKQ